nr:ATP-binding cassette domain-containing protein [Microbacterium sp. NIBRBAC000506063]
MTLAVHNVEVVYEDVMLVVKGASIRIPRDSIVALLGANGAGKTSLLRAMSGLLDVHRGRITRGHISIDEAPLNTKRAADVVRAGVSQVMEGRRVFVEFTVDENLRVGAYTRTRADLAEKLDRIYTMFPCSGSAGASGRATSPAASSRCSPSAAPSWPSRSTSSSTNRASDWPRRSSSRSAISSSTSVGAAPECCWSSRTPRWRCPSPITATSWRTGRS